MAIGLALVFAGVGASAARAATSSTVVIPRLGGGVVAAYARLHAAGLRVSIPRGVAFSSAASPTIAWSVPRSGRRVRRGSVVVLFLSPGRWGPTRTGAARRLVVAPFVGSAARAAYSWVRAKKLPLTAYLGPLKAGGASGLLANYRVSRQRPGAGAHLTWPPRPARHGAHARGAAYRGPLTVWGAQPPPSVQTGPAAATDLTTTTLTGTVTTYGSATTYYFEYGPTRAYGRRTGSRPAPWTEAPFPVSGGVAHLSPATNYHYRLVAANGAGATYGPDQTVVTRGYYQNAVYTTAATPDPFVLDVGDTHSDYWTFATGNLFPVLHSTDLVHWSPRATALAARPAWATKTSDWHPWAPSVLESNQACPGTISSRCYVMYYVALSAALNVNCIGLATSPTPGGPYRDQGPLSISPSTATPSSSASPIGCRDDAGKGNIDPSPFVDASGQAYLYVSTDRACSGGSCTLKPTISVIPLEADLQHAAGPRTALISGDPGTWEAAGVQRPTVEGPSVELHDGTYYLFYSGGSWRGAYGSGYATSTTPTGPFTKAPSNPILAMSPAVRTPGGGDVIVTGPHQGQWLVYAGRDQTFTADRMLRLDRFSWRTATGATDVPAIAGPTTTPQATQP